MRILLFILSLIPQITFAMNANIHLTFEEDHLKINYEFPEKIEGFIFTYPVKPNRNKIFENFPEAVNDVILVNAKNFLLKTFKLQDISHLVQSGNIISQDTKDTLLLTDLTETFRVINNSGIEEYLKILNYYYNGKLIHTRDVYDGNTWERYLLLRNSQNIIESDFGDIIIDTDMPHREMFISEIQRSLKFLNENLGQPKEKVTVFFSYTLNQNEPWWYDGRVIMGSPYVEISLGGELNLEDAKGKVVLYHALFSHEIAHHWNARNLEGESSSWIHEGGAEYLSTLISKALYSEQMSEYVDYMEKSNIESCMNPDEETDFAYHCGHLIFKIAMENSSVNAFEIFKELHDLPIQTDNAVLEIFKKYTSIEAFNEINEILIRDKK